MTKTKSFDPTAFQQSAASAAALLKAMANENRLMILCRLGADEISVSELQQDFDLSQSALSQHLAILRQQKLVETRKDGQTVFYKIADPAVVQVINTLASIFCPEMLK